MNQPGLLSTLQDRGRHFYREQAVPVSGCMDAFSAAIANLAVGNDRKEAVMECTYAGASFTTLTPVLLAYAGGGAVLKIQEVPLPSGRPLFIPAEETIQLTGIPGGCRTYVAVAGGWNVPEVLGSRSTYLTAAMGGYKGRALQDGDLLTSKIPVRALSARMYQSLQGDKLQYPQWHLAGLPLPSESRNIIRVVAGQERHWFEEHSFADLLTQPFRLTRQCNRMGYQLEGCLLHRRIKAELLSTAVVPGTIQVTGSGNPILLMADCQTTGGYPRIAQVAAVDLPLCGQLKPGDIIYFRLISASEAGILYIEREQELSRLADAVQCKYHF